MGDARGAGRGLWGPRSVVARLSPCSLLFPRNQLSPKLVGHFYALATPCRIKLFKISFSFPRARATRLYLRESEGGRGKAWPVAVRPVAAGAPQGPAPPLALGTVPGRFPGAKESEGRSRAEASTAPAPSRHPPGDGPLGPLLLDCFKTSSRGDAPDSLSPGLGGRLRFSEVRPQGSRAQRISGRRAPRPSEPATLLGVQRPHPQGHFSYCCN